MNKFILQRGLVLFSLFSILLSCSDETLEAGLDILPDGDILSAGADTLAISCYTQKGLVGAALASASSTAGDNYPVGHVLDEVFGETYSDVIMEFGYNSLYYYGFDTVYESDEVASLKLYLNMSELDAYGESGTFDIEAYKLNGRYNYSGSTSLGVHSNYFDESGLVSNSTVHSEELKSNIVGLDSGRVYLVIDLTKELGKELLDTNTYKSIDSLYARLNGLYLRAQKKEDEIGALQNFYPDSSALVIEYKRPTTADSSWYTSFSVTNYKCTYRPVHTLASEEFKKAFRDSVKQHSNLYIQSLGGTKGLIIIDSLDAFKRDYKDKIGINLAELVLPINKDYLTDDFALPERLTLKFVGRIEDGYSSIYDDFSTNYFNGFLDEENNEYRINISEYINQYLDSDITGYKLHVMVAENPSAAESTLDYQTPSRVVLHSGLEQENKAFVRVIYTILDSN